jgi:hypothetical protein
MLAFICGFYGVLAAAFSNDIEEYLPSKKQNGLVVFAGGSIVFGFLAFVLSIVIAAFG